MRCEDNGTWFGHIQLQNTVLIPQPNDSLMIFSRSNVADA